MVTSPSQIDRLDRDRSAREDRLTDDMLGP
jgi:hypothetical protein